MRLGRGWEGLAGRYRCEALIIAARCVVLLSEAEQAFKISFKSLVCVSDARSEALCDGRQGGSLLTSSDGDSVTKINECRAGSAQTCIVREVSVATTFISLESVEKYSRKVE